MNNGMELIHTAVGGGLMDMPGDWGSMSPERLQECMDEVRTVIANSQLVDDESIKKLLRNGASECNAVKRERGKICFQCDYCMANRCLLRPSERMEDMVNGKHAECPKNKWLVEWTDVDDIVTPHSDKLVITIGTGDLFHDLLDIVGPLLGDYADRIGADYVELRNETQIWWGLEKFRVHKFAQQYGRTIYLDGDVIVLPRARDLFKYVDPQCVAAHDDRPYFNDHQTIYDERKEMFGSQDVGIIERDTWINAGVVVSSNEHSDMWSPPPNQFQPTHCSEQLWVEQVALGYPFEALPTELNCQYWIKGFFDRVRNAEIIHLSACTDGDERIKMARKFSRW